MEKAICRANLFPGTCKYDHSVNRAGSVAVLLGNRGGFGLKKKFSSLSLKPQSLKSKFYGNRIVLGNNQRHIVIKSQDSVKTQAALRIGTVQKWWEKGLQPNMKEITSAQDLVDSLTNAGDKLVVVDFFSPGCGGCKALHPKMCQLAEMNPEVEFLQVNYEEHKSMCYSLGVHVLPFFRFYRGAHGRLCSFSCTNATIKKFKDALAKHGSDRCSLGPTKGLEEIELISLSANKDLNFTFTPVPTQPEPVPANGKDMAEETKPAKPDPVRGFPFHLPSANNRDTEEKKALVASGR